jgi:hypothetical protein
MFLVAVMFVVLILVIFLCIPASIFATRAKAKHKP